MRRWIVPVALGMVVLYAVLAIGTSCCLFLHGEQLGQVHHHSPSHAGHSALCAWACQGNPAVSILIATPMVVTFAFVAMLWLVDAAPPTGLFAAGIRSRAPPR